MWKGYQIHNTTNQQLPGKIVYDIAGHVRRWIQESTFGLINQVCEQVKNYLGWQVDLVDDGGTSYMHPAKQLMLH